MAKIIICEECGQEKEHYAKGLCATSYQRRQRYSKGKRCTCGKLITNSSTRCRSCESTLRFSSGGRNHRGKNNPNWKGGTAKTLEGRILLYAPNGPMSDARGYVRRSRLVVSEYLGRPLEPRQVVHHVDGDVANDSIDNLWLFADRGVHTKYHKQIEARRKSYHNRT